MNPAQKTDDSCVVTADVRAPADRVEPASRDGPGRDVPVSWSGAGRAPERRVERDQALDALKGLAIAGVLFAHMSFSSRFSANTMAGIGVIQEWFGWCVSAFFFAAGRLTRDGASRTWYEFVLKRARRLLVPCLAFSIAYKCCLAVLHHAGALRGHPVLPHINLIGWAEFLLLPVGPQFYFLPYLFAISVMAVAAIQIARGARALDWMVLVAVGAFYCRASVPAQTYGPTVTLTPGYVLSFWLGLACRQSARESRWFWLMAVSAILFGCWARHTLAYAQFALPAGLYWVLRRLSYGGALSWLGRQAGAIYVWHDPLLLPACSVAASKLLGNEAEQVAVIMVVGLTAPILIGAAVRRFRCLAIFHF